MRNILCFLLLAASLPAEEIPVANGTVEIPYGEFRSLLRQIERSQVKLPVEPVAAAIAKVDYVIDCSQPEGLVTASFEVTSFSGNPAFVPLLGDSIYLASSDAKGGEFVRHDGRYGLVIPSKGPAMARCTFRVPRTAAGDAVRIGWEVEPATIATAEIVGAEPSTRLANAVRTESGQWVLGSTKCVEVILDAPVPKGTTPVEFPPVIREVTASMRVVKDGSFVNRMKWHLRHQKAVKWRVALDKNCPLVSASVDGRAAAPERIDANTIEFVLPAAVSGGTQIEFSYTGRTTPFGPVRGELALALPMTALLVEACTWEVALPSGYAVVALEGNVESAPGPNGSLILRKELIQGEAPSARIFYQKPEKP